MYWMLHSLQDTTHVGKVKYLVERPIIGLAQLLLFLDMGS